MRIISLFLWLTASAFVTGDASSTDAGLVGAGFVRPVASVDVVTYIIHNESYWAVRATQGSWRGPVIDPGRTAQITSQGNNYRLKVQGLRSGEGPPASGFGKNSGMIAGSPSRGRTWS